MGESRVMATATKMAMVMEKGWRASEDGNGDGTMVAGDKESDGNGNEGGGQGRGRGWQVRWRWQRTYDDETTTIRRQLTTRR